MKVVAVILALLGAVHVSIPAAGMAAPVPVLLVFAAVIGGLLWLIWGAAFRSQVYWTAGATDGAKAASRCGVAGCAALSNWREA